MTWRELACYVKGLPDTCRVARSIAGDVAGWSSTERILADIFDVLAIANWQRMGDKNRSRPQPYPRPQDKRVRDAIGRGLKRLKKGVQDG
jgi:hypothetical protein